MKIERKAIEYLKEYIKTDKENIEICEVNDFYEEAKHISERVKHFETILDYISELEKEIDELKEHIRKRIEYTQDLEKDLFENCENYVVNKNKIRNLKEKYENKCAVLGKHSDNFQWYEMGKIFGKAELCEELLGGQ